MSEGDRTSQVEDEDGPEQEAYRAELVRWIAANRPAAPDFHLPPNFLEVETVEQCAYLRDWQRRLFDAGYVGLEVPREYGGPGGEAWQQKIVNQELFRAKAPALLNVVGTRMAMPTILTHGTEEQKQRFVKKILSAEEIWCQGFSEPNAGSDLASVQTTVERRDDHWLLNGHKVWTTQGHLADFMILLGRTDKEARKHAGLSYFLVPMKLPGIQVRPLVKMTREATFNQVIFDDVKIPLDALLGEEGQGWQVAMTTLLFERGGAGSGERAASTAFTGRLRQLVKLGVRTRRGGDRAIDDPLIRDRLVELAIEAEAVRLHGGRAGVDALQDWPMGLALMTKLSLSELSRRFELAAQEIQGPMAVHGPGSPGAVAEGEWQLSFMNAYGPIIGGGTSEVQKNIIGERVLGLAKG